jgi:hypothetical protein
MRDKPNDRKEISVGKTVRTRENRKEQEGYQCTYNRQKEEKRDDRQDTSA